MSFCVGRSGVLMGLMKLRDMQGLRWVARQPKKPGENVQGELFGPHKGGAGGKKPKAKIKKLSCKK